MEIENKEPVRRIGLNDVVGMVTGPEVDWVHHPPHYKSDIHCRSCGATIECIDIIEKMSLVRGTAIKYLWRAGKKLNLVEDLKKAVWYIQREIETLEAMK